MHPMGRYAHMFRQEIQSHVLPVEHQFDRLVAGCPTQSDGFAEHESGGHLEKTKFIVRTSHQTPMAVVRHPQHFMLHVEFELVRFFVKTGPSPVASPFDSGIYRLLCRTERAELRAQGVDINGSWYLRLGVVDAPAVLRIHIYNRQRSCRRCGAYGDTRQRPKHTSYPCNHSFHATKKLQIYELRCKVTTFFAYMQEKIEN